MLSYTPTTTSTNNKGRLKLGSARASSPTALFVSFLFIQFCVVCFFELYLDCVFLLYCFVCQYQSSDWLQRMSPKLRRLCRVGRSIQTLPQLQRIFLFYGQRCNIMLIYCAKAIYYNQRITIENRATTRGFSSLST